MKTWFSSLGWRRLAIAAALIALPVAAFAADAICGCGCPFC